MPEWRPWQRCDNFGANSLSDLASLLGVHVVECNIDSSSSVDTGINVNAGGRGLTIIAILSVQWSSDDLTGSRIDMIRCGHSNNYMSVKNISQDAKDANYISLMNGITYSVNSSNGKLVVQSTQTGYGKILFIMNR